MRAHYQACIQYVLVCVGYAYSISYDIIEICVTYNVNNKNVGIVCRPAKPYGRISHLLDWDISGGRAFPERSSKQAGSQGDLCIGLCCCLVGMLPCLLTGSSPLACSICRLLSFTG